MFQPPTDSLYKFLAVAGIAFFVGSMGFAYREFERYQDRLLSLYREGELAKYQFSIVQEKMDRLERRKNELQEQKQRTRKPIPKAALNDFGSELDKVAPELDKTCFDKAKVAVKAREFVYFQKIQYWYFGFCAFGALTGLALSLVGFRLWYLKLQRHHDAETLSKSGTGEPHGT